MIQNHSVAEQLFAGKGEMAMRMRSHDWSQTRVGSVQSWSQSLKSLIKTLLTSRYPMVLTWGAEFTQFYNDAYSQLIGDKHPAALGTDIRETLAEAWDTLGPMIQRVMATGVANWTPALLLLLERAGYREESYFSVSHAPAEDDAGQIVGMLAVCSEVTQQVLGERRLRLLRDLASQAGETRSVQDTCQDLMAAIAAHPLDVPFALLYLRESDGKTLTLQGTVGLAADEQRCPDSIALTTDSATSHPLWSLTPAASGETILVEELDHHMTVSGGPWNEPVHTALIMPIASSSQTATLGVLVAGVNPNRALDEGYRSFYELLIGQVSLSIRNAQAYEEERRRAEMLAELDRAKTAFFSNVSHEFRTPLTLMLGPLEELSNTLDGQLQPDQREQLQLIQRNGLRLQKLVNTLLDFSRIEAERVQASYEPTDLAIYTAELASMFRSLIERAGMSLIVDCPALPELVYVDRDLWEKVVLNLMSNAFKFTFTGSITVRLQAVGTSVELSVTDTGVGIPEAELPRLFERFHRVSGTRSRTYEGSGIGLSLVQELVKLHGGTIHVTSQVDCGTTFTIALPFGTAHLPQDQIEVTRTLASTALGANPYLAEASRWIAKDGETGSEGVAEWGRSGDFSTSSPRHFINPLPARILLADDNADMRDYVKRLLSQHCEVETVTNGLEALQAISQRLPDLVLSDVMMPGLDGFGLLRELRANPCTKEIPLILLSARAGEESRIEGLEAGADDYLIKPFSARELLARVEASLKLGQLRKAAAQQKQEALWLEAQTARDSLESLLARIDDQFLALDREWRYTYVNDRVTEVTGIARENLLGRSIWEVFPDTVDSQFEREVHRAVAEQVPVQFEYFYPKWNRWFENHVYPSADGMSIIVTEITERKQAEAALQESEARYRLLAEAIPQLVWMTDPNGQNEYVNQRFCDYTGLTAEQMRGSNWLSILHPDDLEMTRDRWLAALNSGQFYEIEYRFRRADGGYRWFLGQGIPLKDEQGQVYKWFGTCTDIEPQKQIEQARLRLLEQEQVAREQAETANRIKDEFLAVLSHELRSPLNPILGWSKLLRSGKLDATRTTHALETIERNAQLQAQLIDDLLDISRILRGKLTLTVAPVDLSFVISAALETVRLAAEAKSLQIQTIILPIIGAVNGDAGRLQQVVWNLLSNAVKFTPVGGHITIKLSSVGTNAQIQVKDTGKGIKPDFLPYIFEHFRQEDGATTRKFGGLGLGLAIARQIVEMHGGTVKAESQGEGMGATFIVELPLLKSEGVGEWRSRRVGEGIASSIAHPLTGLHILLVDDETDTREFQAFVLEQGGANVTAVASGFEALQTLEQFTPDVLISDVGMAEMDGYMLMQQIRARLSNQGRTIPAIALTAYARDLDQQQAISAGFHVHLTKPIEPEALISAIVDLMNKSIT